MDRKEALMFPNQNIFWPNPKSRDVGSFGGIDMYVEVLQYARKEAAISSDRLMSEEYGIGQRLRGSLLIRNVTSTVARDVIRELEAYEWIHQVSTDSNKYSLTAQGQDMAQLAINDLKLFRRTLSIKMHDRFIIPGWFIHRLLELNPDRQGEVVLPGPLKDKVLLPRNWEEIAWTDDLEEIARDSAKNVMKKFPGSFPVNIDEWIVEVQKEWKHVGGAKRKKVSKIKKNEKDKEKPRVKTFSTRQRLSLSMREASVILLFGNTSPISRNRDFDNSKHPIPTRSFQSWCPMLDALEFIFYTDNHPDISGRLIFPCGSFNRSVVDNFETLEIIEPLNKNHLRIFQPKWENMRTSFIVSLQDVYSQISKRRGLLYISLLDVRDEVCRVLRLSSIIFDEFLEKLYRESIVAEKQFSISLESDIRPSLQGGSGLFRRPVFVDKVPYSLIAISVDKLKLKRERLTDYE